MKLTKNRLKEIIREEIQKLNEGKAKVIKAKLIFQSMEVQGRYVVGSFTADDNDTKKYDLTYDENSEYKNIKVAEKKLASEISKIVGKKVDVEQDYWDFSFDYSQRPAPSTPELNKIKKQLSKIKIPVEILYEPWD